MNKRCRK